MCNALNHSGGGSTHACSPFPGLWLSRSLGNEGITDNEKLLVTISFQNSEYYPEFLRALAANHSDIELEYVAEKIPNE